MAALQRGRTSIQWKMLAAFMAVVLGALAIAVTAMVLQKDAADHAAVLEAEHLAQAIAHTGTANPTENPEALQAYVDRVSAMFHRDILVVDRHNRVVAATAPKVVGTSYPDADIAMTMLDGTARTVVTTGPLGTGALKQMVVPLRANAAELGSPTVGAVVLEYTAFYEALMQEARRSARITGVVTAVLVVLGGLLAVRITLSVVEPLIALQEGVTAVASERYSTRVRVHTKDEIGSLAAAFNRMAEDLGTSRAALGERANELAHANLLLEAEMAKQKDATERIEYLAYHDALTGLPNRSTFSLALSKAIQRRAGQDRRLGLYFIDVDRFKQINDTLGHEAGDQLLKEISDRLRHALRDTDTVARLGGDEFVVLVPELRDGKQAETVARKILSAISRPFALPGQELRVTASIGISRFPMDGVDEQTLMKRADVAMYQAKENGRNGFEFYDASRDGNTFERLSMESSLRRALERQELVLHYQPKRDFHTGETSGMEALVRWQHPGLGLISPAQFIPLAEETGLIVPIGLWVLRTACQQTMAWKARGMAGLVVAVNLSARQFADENLMVDIIEILEETGMDARLLELEITESTIMRDAEKARQLLVTLKAMGVRIAIDDFGTGHSSLSTLKQFPIDTLKIDRSFVRDLGSNPEDQGLTEAIITLGRTLKLRLVAEGVETREQAHFLHRRGCDELQGYFFSRPVPAGDFETFVVRHRASRVPSRSVSTFASLTLDDGGWQPG